MIRALPALGGLDQPLAGQDVLAGRFHALAQQRPGMEQDIVGDLHGVLVRGEQPGVDQLVQDGRREPHDAFAGARVRGEEAAVRAAPQIDPALAEGHQLGQQAPEFGAFGSSKASWTASAVATTAPPSRPAAM
nr:hypothetical protein [Streptomyces malaysiense]